MVRMRARIAHFLRRAVGRGVVARKDVRRAGCVDFLLIYV